MVDFFFFLFRFFTHYSCVIVFQLPYFCRIPLRYLIYETYDVQWKRADTFDEINIINKAHKYWFVPPVYEY